MREDRPSAFVLMPFDPEFDEIYNLFIADALDEAGYTFFRADDIRNQQNILRDIVTAIETSDLVLADLTGAGSGTTVVAGAVTVGERSRVSALLLPGPPDGTSNRVRATTRGPTPTCTMSSASHMLSANL